MKKNSIIQLTKEQKLKYYMQPDMLPFYKTSLDGDRETFYYVKGLSMRFWFNIQHTGFSPHWHTALEIIMPLEETFTVIMQNEEYHLDTGDIMIIPAGSVHSLRAPSWGSRFIFILELDQFTHLPGFQYILSLLSSPIHIKSDMDSEFYTTEAKLMMELAEHYWGSNITKEINIISCLLKFFSVIGENTVNTAAQNLSSPAQTNSLMARLSMALDYVETHFSENLSLEEVAAVSCFSKYYFSRIFKQYTHQNFTDYLATRRIKAAEQLLIVPNVPIMEVSLKSGFVSLSTFNRTFKNIKGCSPTEYRSLYAVGQKADEAIRQPIAASEEDKR